MTLSLRHRFFLATLAGSALAAAIFTLVASVLLTPRVARRLVEQDARLNLMTLAATMPAGDSASKDAYLRRSSSPAWQGVQLVPRGEAEPPGADVVVTVPLPGTSLALRATPEVSLGSTLAVANPSPWRLAGGALGFLGFVYLLTWALSRQVTRPLSELQAAVTALSEGKRDVTVVLPKEEELAQLAASFNQMAGRLRAREQELAATSARLELELKSKEQIFANTSHELRTPLTVILGYAQMLQDGLKGQLQEQQAESVAVIERNAHRLLAQVEDLLTLSRLAAGHLPLHLESIDLKDLVDEVVSNLRPLFGQQSLQVTWSREGAFPARLDYQRGCQVLGNLLDNARKYGAGTPVGVSLREVGPVTEIEVKDQGPGIPPDLVPRVFDEFERGPQDAEGAGLGLALARGLARQFGGDLRLTETAEGATFIWTVPTGAA